MQAEDDRGRLLILGGGMASLTTAFYASEPDHEKVFPGGIHVFERSDRLGGKGASVRTTTKALENRAEEHGLHVWFGFYDNAFTLLERCHTYLENEARGGYERWATSFRSVEDGFRACSRIGLMDHDGTQWLPWVADFPEDSTARPWYERRGESVIGTPSDLAARGLRMVESFLYSLTGRALGGRDSYSTLLDPSLLPNPVRLPDLAPLSRTFDELVRASSADPRTLQLVSQGLELLARGLLEARSRFDQTLRQHDALRRGWYIADLLLAAVRGIVDDGVLHTGDFSLIDDSELRAWLVLHGASAESVSSSFLKSIVYDLAFAYEGGDPRRPACSAATGVHGLMRVLLTYRGAIMWKMNAGMGEIVFAPIYEALLRRGVKFHFFHEAKSLELERSADRVLAKRISFAVRATSANPTLPSLDIESGVLAGSLPYWPVRKPGKKSTVDVELRAGDMVVYGMPVDTIREIVRDAPMPWQHCAEKVKTVRTMALQLWLSESVSHYAQWASPDITVGAYTEPFDTWSDMATLAGEASALANRPLRSVAYFTNVALPGVQSKDMAQVAAAFVNTGLSNLWPHFDPSMIVDRYARINEDASERYTLSTPGSLRARLSPLDRSIANVRPVGDWTRNSISAGCIEAAVISGMIATVALRPDRFLRIVGEDMSKLAQDTQ